MVTEKYEYELPDHPIEYGVELAIADIHVDPQAQRSLNEGRCQKMANNYIPSAVSTLVVSERDDTTKWVVNGQHRKRMLELLGIGKATCEVHYGLTVTEEAILFLILNKESAQVRPIDRYHIGLTGKIPAYVDTAAVLGNKDLGIGGTSANSVGAVQGILNITEEYGPEALWRTLTIAEAAWKRTPDTWDGMLLAGLGKFIGLHGEAVDDLMLAKKLAKKGPAFQWRGLVLAMSTAGGTGHSGTGGRANAAYNLIKDRWNSGRSIAHRIPS